MALPLFSAGGKNTERLASFPGQGQTVYLGSVFGLSDRFPALPSLGPTYELPVIFFIHISKVTVTKSCKEDRRRGLW